MNKLLATTALLLMTATTAFAATETITGSYSVSYASTQGNSPTIGKLLNTPSSFTEMLAVNATSANMSFLSVSPAGSCSNYYWAPCPNNTAKGVITVTFNITGAGSKTGTGNFIADYNFDPEQTDSVTWNTPDPLVFTLADGNTLDINLINANDWTIFPDVSFTVTTPTQVPEPSSLALVGAGLLGVSGFAWNRRRKALRKTA